MESEMLTFFIIFVGFSMVMTAVIAVVLIRRMKKRGGMFSKHTGIPDHLCKGGEQTAMTGDLEYKTRFWAGSRNSPSRFEVSIDCPTESSFQVTKESGFDRFFKRMGITYEIQTGDAEFDDSFFISADNPKLAEEYFANPEKREAVRAVFEKGFNRVRHDGKAMTAARSPARFDPPIKEADMTKTVSCLAELAREIPDLAQEAFLYEQPGWKAKRAIAFTVSILAGVIGLPAFIFGLVNYEPLDTFSAILHSLAFSIPLLLVFLLLSIVLLKGRSSSHKELMIILIISLTCFPLFGMGTVVFVNGWMDDSESTTYLAPVIGKRISRSDDSTSYHVTVESWREGRRTEDISVSSGDYYKTTPKKSEMVITTRPGYLGFEWVVSHHLRNRAR